MAEHRYRIEVTSSAPPETVFAVLVDGPGWARWAAGVRAASYEREGEPAPHGVGAVRRLGAGRGPASRERVVAYEPPSYFAYEIVSAPIPVTGYRSEVRLAPADGGRGTAIRWEGRFRSWLPGMGWFMRRTVTGFAHGLAAEAERRTGI